MMAVQLVELGSVQEVVWVSVVAWVAWVVLVVHLCCSSWKHLFLL